MTRHFGVLIPATNTTAELEYTRLLPDTIQAHYARLGKAGDSAFAPSRDEDIAYQSKLLGSAKVEVVGLCQTSASLFTDNYDAKARQWMSEGAGVPAITSAEAIGEAVKALDAQRIALVSPYSEAVIGRARDYYQTRYALDVVAMEGFAATDAYAIGALGPEHATSAFDRIDRPDIEVLVVPGGNFPTMSHVQAWESRFGKPVITTNQALLWSMLAQMGFSASLTGLGRLLEQMPARG